jgi:hypothetical protein
MMDDQKIIDNAPKNKNHYFQLFGECKGANDGYINNSVGICRSLADIKELVELRKANTELKEESEFFYEVACESTNPEWLRNQAKALKAGN